MKINRLTEGKKMRFRLVEDIDDTNNDIPLDNLDTVPLYILGSEGFSQLNMPIGHLAYVLSVEEPSMPMLYAITDIELLEELTASKKTIK